MKVVKYLKHQVFFHDPKFFLKSESPDIPINNNDVLNPGYEELSRLVLVKHKNLDVPDKKCSLTNRVKEVFSNEAGFALHWDLDNLFLDLPKCSTIEQDRL